MKDREEYNGTFYSANTHPEVRRILERVRQDGTRIRLHYGDTKTGKDWQDRYDVAGTVGRSMGPVKIPILLHNCNSIGGGGILDDCIVRIRYANRKQGGDMYRHSQYHNEEARQ